MGTHFSSAEWETIMATLKLHPEAYGFPRRVYGSMVFGSFNIRKLGPVKKRSKGTWDFLATICKQFDLLAIQEVMANLEGLRHLVDLLGDDYGLIVSDPTGAFPGESGLAERFAFVYNRRLVQRTEIATDITYDRSKVLKGLAENLKETTEALEAYNQYLTAVKAAEESKTKLTVKKPKLRLPEFLTFIRQPFCVSFCIKGFPDTRPYRLMAINAHLYYGNYMADREQEFDAIMNWIRARAVRDKTNYYHNFMLLGDLNLNFDNPEQDRRNMMRFLVDDLETRSGEKLVVNFPFLDAHKGQAEVFRTNARLNQTYDQIGFFARDKRFPRHTENKTMGDNPMGPDYGVFDFTDLFAVALHGGRLADLEKTADFDKKAFFSRFEHSVSDHMPIWFRMPLPLPDA